MEGNARRVLSQYRHYPRDCHQLRGPQAPENRIHLIQRASKQRHDTTLIYTYSQYTHCQEETDLEITNQAFGNSILAKRLWF